MYIYKYLLIYAWILKSSNHIEILYMNVQMSTPYNL